MKTFIFYLLMASLMCMVVQEASAGRFGGGRSFGVQRSHSSLFASKKTPSQSAASQRSTRPMWHGVLGGLLMGGLLTSLFMGHGFGAGLLSWLAIGFVAFFVINLIRQKTQPAYQSPPSQFFNASQFNKPNEAFRAHTGGGYSAYPAGFEEDVFLRDAKKTFIRLQAAYDQKNRSDLIDFTAPEVFAEIEMQLNERGNGPNITQVLQLDAELLDVSRQANSLMASVRFTGSVKENNNPATALDEIWHFRQFASHQHWVVGGIQQDVILPKN